MSIRYAPAILASAVSLMVALAGAQQTQTPATAPQPAPAPAAAPAPAQVPFSPASTPEQEQLRLVPVKGHGGKVHLLPATMETTQWGWFNNAQPPVLHVNSGDTIVFETMMHSHNQVVPGTTIEQIKKLRTDFPGRGPHTLTGPVYIEGAEPGDVLEVNVLSIDMAIDYGYNGCRGFLPDNCDTTQPQKIIALDRRKMTAEFLPGIVIPLRPFFGSMGVAPAA